MSKAKYEEKFIVINIKRFEELENHSPDGNRVVCIIKHALENMEYFCEKNGIKIDQKYFVCNQDEPYSQKVIGVILDGESKKL